MNKLFLFLMCFILSSINSFAQKSDTSYESLLVNTWRLKSLEVNEKLVPLTEIQKSSKMIFNKDHTSKQVSGDLVEKGIWHINDSASTKEVASDVLPDEIHSLKILKLTSDTLVFEIKHDGNGEIMKFSLYKDDGRK